MAENATKLDLQKAIAHFDKKITDYQLYVDRALIEAKGIVNEWVPTLKDGYTPQKGIDYYTEADKQEMVLAVLDALPDGDEVSY